MTEINDNFKIFNEHPEDLEYKLNENIQGSNRISETTLITFEKLTKQKFKDYQELYN